MDLTQEERAALRYCAPLGIPLSVFLGRVINPGEPDWLPKDSQAAVWWKTRFCTGCGNLIDECWADEEVAPEYDTDVIRCWACEAVGQEMNVIQNNKAAGSGLYVFAKKVEAH